MGTTAAAERLKKLAALLQTERDEDFRLYNEQFLRVSLDERRKNGLTWYPVKINGEELGSGELLHLEIERTSYLDHPHQFSSGKNVSLFCTRHDETKEMTGTVKNAGKNILKLIMHTDELPDWCYEGKLGLNIQFDDNSYNEMQRALSEVINARNNRVAELREIFEGKVPLTFEKNDDEEVVPGLNLSQARAVRHALSVADAGVIHGPPGTGKTTSLVAAIRLTLRNESQVLVCAPTNSAVDLLAEKLTAQGLDVLRLGHPARISDPLLKSSLDGRVSASPFFRDVKQLRRNAEEYFRMAGKYKRVFGKEEARQRAAYYTEARNNLREARQLEDHIVDELFRTAQVICCTPVTSTHRGLNRKKFNTLFFDEASQALEPMVWIPLLKCNRVILCGDHFQLPPVVKSLEAKAGGLDVTLLDRCISLPGSTVLLNRQYRMNNVIMGFSNSWFYGNELVADDTVATQRLVDDPESTLYSCIEFIDTAGCGFEEAQNEETLSYANPGEGKVLTAHLTQLMEAYSTYSMMPAIDIGLISPYKEQREWLQENLPAFKPGEGKLASLSIKTIDGFQGEERDVIYISLVRSNNRQEIGFLNDLRRMNVAITRARKKLVVIGDSATVGATPFYGKFLEYCEKHGAYRSAWEWIS